MKKLILLLLIMLVACAPTEPEPTDVPATAVPTYTALPTYTPFPPTDVPTDAPTAIPATDEPTLTALPPVPVHPMFLVQVTADKANLREVCINRKGELQFNNNGFPLISECIWSSDGTVNGRIRYYKDDLILVFADGDLQFSEIYGVLTLGGNAEIKSDGGHRWYMVSGPRGYQLFVDVELVQFYSDWP